MEEKFAQITQKFATLRPFVALTDGDLLNVRNWLEELHELEYSCMRIGSANRAKLLINQLCSIIPIGDTVLVGSTALIIIKLVRLQDIHVDGRTLLLAIEWCLSALNYGTCDDSWLVPFARVLQAIEALVRDNPHAANQRKPIIELMHEHPHIFIYCDRIAEIQRSILQLPLVRAMEAVLGIQDEQQDDMSEEMLDCLMPFFVHRLSGNITADSPQMPEMSETLPQLDFVDEDMSPHVAILRYSLSGTRYLVQQRQTPLPSNALTQLTLGVCRSYMAYELPGVPFLPPGELHPATFTPPRPGTGASPSPGGPNYTPRQRKRRHVSRLPRERERRIEVENAQRDANMLCMSATFGRNPPYAAFSTSYNPYISPPHGSNEANTSMTQIETTTDPIRTRAAMNEGKVRLEALLLLQAILNNIDKQTLCEHFTSFMHSKAVPIGSVVMPPSGNNLMTCVLKDPSPRCRLAAHLCMQTLLIEGKAMLRFADHRPVPGQVSFIPRCYKMANIVTQLHHCLCLAMNEASHTILTQLLKTTALVVRSTYYEWLGPGLCAKIVRNVKQLVDHPDTSVQVGALTVIGCLLAHSQSREIQDAFEDSNEIEPLKRVTWRDYVGMDVLEGGSEAYAVYETPTRETLGAPYDLVRGVQILEPRPWLIDQCFYNLRADNEVPAPIKIESLQIIGAMCERYFLALIYPFLASVGKTLLAAFVDQDNLDVLHHATKAMEQLGEALNVHYEMRNSIDESLTLWQTLIDGPLRDFTGSEFPVLRAGAADCIGAIGDHTFELLPSNVQLVCITVLLSLAVDADTNVRSSAVRAIGILLLYPAVRSFSGYMVDAADIIVRAMTDCSNAVRVRASWGLGNLSDALLQESALELTFSDSAFDEMPVRLKPVIRAAIDGSNDQDKIRSNAVRALGNLLQLLVDADEDMGQRATLHEGVDALLQCARTADLMKARWNACYALGNVLKIPAVYTVNGADGVNLAMRIFLALGCILAECTNIKVRINAAVAVTSCTTRAGFGNNYLALWASLVNGLVTVENIVDANEYQHRDKLAIQTCVTLAHMTRLVLPEDLEMLADVVSDGADSTLAKQVQRVYDRLPPESHTPLFEADERLNLLQEAGLGERANRGLLLLIAIFRQRLGP